MRIAIPYLLLLLGTSAFASYEQAGEADSNDSDSCMQLMHDDKLNVKIDAKDPRVFACARAKGNACPRAKDQTDRSKINPKLIRQCGNSKVASNCVSRIIQACYLLINVLNNDLTGAGGPVHLTVDSIPSTPAISRKVR